MARLDRLLALVYKEMMQLLRDRRTLLIILSIPLIELFLFAYAVDLTVDRIPMSVADMAMDRQSRAFIDALEVSGFFDIVSYVPDQPSVVRTIDEGSVRAGLVIPPDFAAEVARNRGQILLLLDGSDSFTVQSGYGAAVAIAQAHSLDLLTQEVSHSSGRDLPLPVQATTRILYNPTMDDMIFILPGMAAMLLQVMSMNLTALSVVRERELGTIEQLLSTPIRPIELMLGKLLPNIILSGIALLSVVLIGIHWFGVPFQGNPWLFAWLSLLFIVSGLGLGLLISSVAQNQKQAQQLTSLLLLLSLLLTGFIYPREPMPGAIRLVGNLIPLTYFNRITRAIFTKGVGLAFIWEDVLALFIYGVVAMVAATATFRKRLD